MERPVKTGLSISFADMMIERIKSLSSKDGWKKPWFTEGSLSWPKNLSGREYNGMNALMRAPVLAA